MIENNCSCSVLSNKIDKSIIRRYDNNKGRKRSGLDKRKLQAVEKAIESLAPQGFLPVRRAPLVRAPASHAGGRWFESISLHQDIETRTFPIMGWFGFSVLSILAKIAGLIDEKLSSLRSICRIPCDSRQGLCPIFQYLLFIHIRRVPSAPF